jgi:hypothetical protein
MLTSTAALRATQGTAIATPIFRFADHPGLLESFPCYRIHGGPEHAPSRLLWKGRIFPLQGKDT